MSSSHATIGNSTFAVPRSDITMPSIAGPSDSTEDLLDYINGEKQPSASMTAHATIEHPTLTVPRAADTTMSSIAGPSDFTENLLDYINGKKQPSVSMTSHATIGNSTFAVPPSADSTMSSIIGPSDFTENLVDYMKDNRQRSASTKSHATIGNATIAVPRSADITRSSIGGLSDFTQNLLGYVRGNKQPLAKKSSPFKSKIPKLKHDKSTVTSTRTNAQTTKKSIEPADKVKQPSKTPKNPVATDGVNINKSFSQPNETCSNHAIEEFDIEDLSDELTSDLEDYINGNEETVEPRSDSVEESLRAQIAQLQAQLLKKDDKILELQTSLEESNQLCQGLELKLHQMKLEVDDLQENLNDVIINTVQSKDKIVNRLHHTNEALLAEDSDLRADMGDRAGLEDALSRYADDLNAQHEVSAKLAAKNEKLEATVKALRQRQIEMQEARKKREDEWQERADLLLKEIDRRGGACLKLWGKLEHPSERDSRGKQKYTYKYTKKRTKGAPVV